MSNKTEKPTPERLKKARREGQVAQSKSLTSALATTILCFYLLFRSDVLSSQFEAVLLVPAQVYNLPFPAAISAILEAIFQLTRSILLPIVLIASLSAIVCDLAQVGFMLSFKAVTPSGKKLNIAQNAKNMFSKKTLVDFFQSLLKTAFMGFLVWSLIKGSIHSLVLVPEGGVPAVERALHEMVFYLVVYVSLVYLVMGVVDLAWQRFNHMSQLKMSRDEIRREHKDMEGDPLIKQTRKRLHQEMVAEGNPQAAVGATAVVTNPAHLAVALYYKRGQTPIPMVLAKGRGAVAAYIRRVAEDAGVPVVQNVPLARALYAQVKPEQYIPADLLEPVAELLLWLQRTRGIKLEDDPEV
ncbi:MAG: type III secretion system export apparatus subunit SctU [Parvibaculaceae bacterium]|nr:type III secretion system export apparatus subunit SctU [Parvibaculaceae bacterium]